MKAQWIEGGYGVERLNLGIVEVAVSWALVSRGDPTGYQYRYGVVASRRLYATMDEAKAAAVVSVQKRLSEAMALLSD